jgi:hypothetical protein
VKLFDFSKTPQRVYVLGAGPAGLLAAYAATQSGYEVVIFSAPGEDGAPKKSDLFGCQYLHQHIPGIGIPRFGKDVAYRLNGDPMAYREKVYGGAWDGNVSPDEYGPEQAHQAWDLRKAYDELWHRFAERVVPGLVTPNTASALYGDEDAFIISSIPAPALCKDMENHKFQSQRVWAMGTRGPMSSLPYRAPDMTVECDGTRDKGWYRAATVFGHSTLEWPTGHRPPISGVAAVSKPLSTDCTCNPGKRWLRVGRYGQWKKGVLVHTAYEQTMEWLQ